MGTRISDEGEVPAVVPVVVKALSFGVETLLKGRKM